MIDKPVGHVIPLDSTGLKDAPITTTSVSYEDSETELSITAASQSMPAAARLTVRMDSRLADGGLLDGVSWIWYPEGDATVGVPGGTRYFRTEFEVPTDAAVERARVVGTCDNEATFSLNGERVGETDDWTVARLFDAGDVVKTGRNALAVTATNWGDSPNPAGLLARLEVALDTGETLVIDTDGTWRASKEAMDGWTEPSFDDSAWVNASELGEYGIGPWGDRVNVDSSGSARVKLVSPDERVRYGDPATVTGDTAIRTTGWVAIPPTFDGGRAVIQAKSGTTEATTRITAATLELVHENEI